MTNVAQFAFLSFEAARQLAAPTARITEIDDDHEHHDHIDTQAPEQNPTPRESLRGPKRDCRFAATT